MVEKGQVLSLPGGHLREDIQKTSVFRTVLELVAGLRGLVNADLWTSPLVTANVKGFKAFRAGLGSLAQ
jgi:hypothetical protein